MTSGILDLALIFNFRVVSYGKFNIFKEKLDKCRNDELSETQGLFIKYLDTLIENDQKDIKDVDALRLCDFLSRKVLIERSDDLMR